MAEHIQDRLAPPTIAARRVLLLAGGMLLFLAATFVGLGLIYFSVIPEQRMQQQRRTFPAPGLSAHPATELNELLAAQRKALDGYRWANAEHTLVAIPIEQAMKLVAERGAQAYAPVTAETPP